MIRAVIWCAVSSPDQAEEDKDSMEDQERNAVAFCEREGWQVIDILRTPGYSRRYLDFHEMAYDWRKQGIDTADRLYELWQSNGFDVMVVRDEKRFAREQSLHAYIIAMTMRSGARIYTLDGGWIDQTNYRFKTAMGGLNVSTDVDEMQFKLKFGMKKRVKLGLSSHRVPLGFELKLKDNRTRTPETLIHSAAQRQLIDDMATLLLEGVGWDRFGAELYRRFGHLHTFVLNKQEHTKPYSSRTIYKFFHSPYSWGHTAYGYGKRGNEHFGAWTFDESEPLPEGITDGYTLFRNQHEPLFTGELAEQIKAELRRRDNAKGRSFTNKAYFFTGLLMCASCGNLMTIHYREHYYVNGEKRKSSPYAQWYCNHARKFHTCPERRIVPDKAVWTYVNKLLKEIQKRRSLDILQGNTSLLAHDPIEKYRRDIATLERQIDRLIADQSKAPANVHGLYAGQIAEASARLEVLQGNLAALAVHHAEIDRLRLQERAFNNLLEIRLTDFWELSPKEVNKRLRALFADVRIETREGQIVGLRQVGA